MTDTLTIPQFTTEDHRLFAHGLSLCIEKYESCIKAVEAGKTSHDVAILLGKSPTRPTNGDVRFKESKQLLLDYYDSQIKKCQKLRKTLLS